MTIPKTSTEVIASTQRMEAGLRSMERTLNEALGQVADLAGCGLDPEVLRLLTLIAELRSLRAGLVIELGGVMIAHRTLLPAPDPTPQQ